MCESKENGGQRCYRSAEQRLSTARKRYHAAQEAAEAAKAIGSPDAASLRVRAMDEFARVEDAVADFASARGGEREIQHLLAAPSDGSRFQSRVQIMTQGVDLKRALEQGLHRREKNEAVRRAVQTSVRQGERWAEARRDPGGWYDRVYDAAVAGTLSEAERDMVFSVGNDSSKVLATLDRADMWELQARIAESDGHLDGCGAYHGSEEYSVGEVECNCSMHGHRVSPEDMAKVPCN